MPYGVKKVKPDKRGRRFAIYNKITGKIVGRSMSEKKANIAADKRNKAH